MKHRGFSLVELSIVLVILGLLTGGILTGQQLIEAAELRAISQEQEQFTTAIMAFKNKYFGLPGDLTNATDFWGTAGGNGANAACYDVFSTTGATCNGDGNNQVLGAYGPGNEGLRMWQHLSNAGLLAGSYAGGDATDGGYGDFLVADVNVPSSKFGKGTYWYAGHQPTSAGDASNFAVTASNFMRITGTSTFLLPEQAWNIDKKVDDGRPNTGNMVTNKGDATYPCTDAAGVVPPGDANAQYNLTSSVSSCLPWWYF